MSPLLLKYPTSHPHHCSTTSAHPHAINVAVCDVSGLVFIKIRYLNSWTRLSTFRLFQLDNIFREEFLNGRSFISKAKHPCLNKGSSLLHFLFKWIYYCLMSIWKFRVDFHNAHPTLYIDVSVHLSVGNIIELQHFMWLLSFVFRGRLP